MNEKWTEGQTEVRSEEGRVESHMHLHSRPEVERAPMNDRHYSRDGLRARAARLADETRDTLENAADQMNDLFDRRAELTRTIREHPATATGAAFAFGFLAAALTGRRRRNWLVVRLRKQARGLLVGGIASILAHEFREIVSSEEYLGRWIHSRRDDFDEEAELEIEFDLEELDDLEEMYEDDFL